MIEPYEFINKVYKTQRDIVSRDYDRVAKYIQKLFNFKEHKFKSGTEHSGWKIPKAWHLHSAYLNNDRGTQIIELDNPLRVMRYSKSVAKFIEFNELKSHIKIDARLKDGIPYVSNPYPPYDWAFCMTLEEFASLDREATYYVNIDSEFTDGEMTVLEYVHQGISNETIIFNAHLDGVHQADFGLSGVAMLLLLIEHLQQTEPTHFTYRFVIGPQTIGPIAYLTSGLKCEDRVNIIGGVDLDFMGNSQLLKIQRSKFEEWEIDLVGVELKRNNIVIDSLYEFGVGIHAQNPHQFPDTFTYNAFEIPMISIFRIPYRYSYTHMDDISEINEISLEESFEKCLEILEILENNKMVLAVKPGPIFLDPKEFPQNLIPEEFNFYKFCNLYDGSSVLDIAQEMKVLFLDLNEIIKMLEAKGLIKTVWESDIMLEGLGKE